MITLGENIKKLRSLHHYNQSELAHLLKVSQTSIAHYEKGSRQPTLETLIEMSNIFQVTIDDLLGHRIYNQDKNKKNDFINSVNQLFILLKDKKEDEFSNMISYLSQSVPLIDMIEYYVKEVMEKVGHEWHKGTINVGDEHYASQVMKKNMYAVSLMQNEATYKRVMTMTVPGEEHTLAIELISNYLKQEGIESYCFGSNLPIHSLLENIKTIKPDCLVLSMTLKKHTNNLLMLLDYLYEFYPKLPIVIGGQAIDELVTIQFKQNIKLIHSLDELKDTILNEGSENHE